MERSTIVSRVLLFALFVVLVKIPEIRTTTSERSPYAKDGFLAGENTPVWVAQLQGKKIVYSRVQMPIVLEAMNYWNLLKQNDSFPIRVKRSGDYRENFDSEEVLDASRNAGEFSYHSPRLVEKRSTDDVRYPTVLVVMHYSNIHPSITRTQWTTKELVLYALAFWGTVDSSLRVIQNPRVSLRIAGIIITHTRDASPYLAWNDGERSFGGTLCPMMDHWRSLAEENADFPLDSYDIVAHMTNAMPRSDNDQCSNLYRQNNVMILGVGTQGPPCSRADQITGLIVHDDLAFNGLHRTIGQMSRVLGGNDQSQRKLVWPRLNWKKETLDHFSHVLKPARCMSVPKEYHPPGSPVAPILAGDLMPSERQCEMYGYGPSARPCWNPKFKYKRTICFNLPCAKQDHSDDTCQFTKFTLDGTVCNDEKTKICLDGECVDKPYP